MQAMFCRAYMLKTVTFWIQWAASLTRVPIFSSKWIKAMLSDSWCSGKFFVWRKNGEQQGGCGGFPHIGKLDMAFTLVCWPFCKILPKVERTREFRTYNMYVVYNKSGNQSGPFVHYRGGSFAKFSFVFSWSIHQPAVKSWKPQKQELMNYWQGHAAHYNDWPGDQ